MRDIKQQPELIETVCVPVSELDKLEQARNNLYIFLEGAIGTLSIQQTIMLQNEVTQQMWRVANTKKWVE
jgi:uncharacterized protein YaaW (UPF0174 family)